MSNATTVLPNPYTPMAFVSPESAIKYTNQTYSAVGSLAVLIWDIIIHLVQDYELLKRHGINISFIIYFIARIASFAYVTGIVIIITAPIGNCNVVRQVSLLYPFTIPLTVLLFVLRVSALYHNNKYIIALFSTTWLSVLAACIAVPIGAIGIQIGPTEYCVDDKTPFVAKLCSFCPFLHDFLIFIATSWALTRSSYSDVNVKNGLSVMILGKHLPAFSKSILRDGQAYFLATLILNLFFFATYYMPDPIVTPCTVGMPLFVLISNMSSYVYRNIRFEKYRDHTIHTSFIERAFHGQAMPPSQKPVDIFFKPATTTCSVHGTGVVDLEEGYLEYVDSSEEKNREISLEEVETCSRKDTMVK